MSTMSTTLKPSRNFSRRPLVAACIALCVGLTLAIMQRGTTRIVVAPTSPVSAVSPPAEVPRPSPEEWARPHLERASSAAARAVEQQLAVVDAFFADAKQGTRAFASEALGFGSKWRWVASKLPYARKDRHEKFLRAKFEQHVFSAAELQAMLDRLEHDLVSALGGIDNALLVALRADVAGLPDGTLVGRLDPAALRARFDSLASHAEGHARVGEEVGVSVGIIVGTEVALVAGQRLAMSAGLLGAGAAFGIATFGAGLVVSWLVDTIVDRVRDSDGKLARKVDQELDAMHRTLVEGKPGQPGLRQLLADVVSRYAASRRVAVLALLQPTNGAI